MAASSKQKRGRKKAAWDNTVRDLTGLKLSDKELEQRRQLFKSKNMEKARRELYDKPSHTLSKTSKDNKQSLRELLQEAQESLDRVQGLSMTSDSPKRYNVNPMITPAPTTATTADHNKENIVGNYSATPDDDNSQDRGIVSDPRPCTTTSRQIYESCPLQIADEPHPLESDNTTYFQQEQILGRDTDYSVMADSVRKLEIMVEELMHNNRILTETIFEQQATIDILSQDLIYLKEHSEKLEKTISDRINSGLIVPHPLWPHPPIKPAVIDGVRDSSVNNETFVSLPTLKNNEHIKIND